MAFNFNWTPLAADETFYQQARDLLTVALNRSERPPIIVDDILVSELHLGSTPPDLELLEVGDLAEDRFRGIFKLRYSGDAYITLKTRVQANPLNTYLYSKPSFTSPQPLAAASSLTIPLAITLSDIKLSAFIILVFSKQKGITVVFRNDPLESVKVSSTFDSIQFVRDYLQRTIESKLRDLMMDELPAIIHRLSLRLWCPQQLPKEDLEVSEENEPAVNPLSQPPPDAVNANGNLVDPHDVSSMMADGGPELQSLFSQKNLLRLASLTNAHRTLSLFTPSINEVVFRAWSGPDRHDPMATPPLATPSLARSLSYHGASTTYTFSDTSSVASGAMSSRPSMVSLNSATTGLTLGSNRHAKPNGRKKKNRVVNLRKNKSASQPVSEAGDTSSDTVSVQGPQSEPAVPAPIPEEAEESTLIGSMSTASRVRFRTGDDKAHLPNRQPLSLDMYDSPAAASASQELKGMTSSSETIKRWEADTTSAKSSTSKDKAPMQTKRGPPSETSEILEQAWIMKMAGEIARRVYDEKQRNPNLWDEREEAPPAYEAR